jgi:lipase maturation factor
MNPPSIPSTFAAAETAPPAVRLRTAPTYWLTRFVLLRLMGLVYLTAFLVAANQIIPLIGHDGLIPADKLLPRAQQYYGSPGQAFLEMPSLFWWDISDAFLQKMAWAGVALSALVLCGYANSILMLLLWALYMSFVHVGQDWYGYGWDIQILETGFLAVFLCPLLDPRPFPRSRPPIVVLWLFRWLIFRIMIGAGLIKWRGDECWRDLTALYYHYETQPLPNPLSRYLHFAPHWFQKFGVLWNFFIELVVPWFGFWPRHARNVAGILLASFQITLICSGNLAFLNWLTLVPCLACMDDSIWRRVLPAFLVRRAERAELEKKTPITQTIFTALLACLVAWLSIKPVQNLFSEHQAMNRSFNILGINLELVNTYGAFGSVGRERDEIVFEGTDDPLGSGAADWREYEFKAKPGDVMRRPPILSPYYYRLDWQIWFAAMATPNDYPWTLHFAWKLMHNDPGVLSLLASNPFPDQPPRHVRAVLYRYRFAPLGNPQGAWWTRERLGLWLPSLSTDSPELRDFLVRAGYLDRAEK